MALATREEEEEREMATSVKRRLGVVGGENKGLSASPRPPPVEVQYHPTWFYLFSFFTYKYQHIRTDNPIPTNKTTADVDLE